MRRLLDDALLWAGRLLLLLSVALLVLPLVVVAAMSFDGREFLGRFPPPSLSLRWYEAFVLDAWFMRSLANSLVLAAASAAAATALGVSAAVVIDRYRFPGRDALTALFLSPVVVPTVLLGFSVLVFLSALRVTDGFTRLVLGHLILTLPYTIRTALASLGGIRRSLTEAALVLGADERAAFREVTLPLARAGVVAGFVLGFALSFEEVSLSLFLYDPASFTLPVAIVSTMRAQFNLVLAAASVLIIAVTVLLVLLVEHLVGLDRAIGGGVHGG